MGSLNLVKHVQRSEGGKFEFNWDLFKRDVAAFVRALDNVVDIAKYPLPEQEQEAKNKRRMGVGITGLANAVEALGAPYGSKEALDLTQRIMKTLTITAYETSIQLAKEKGAFPLFDAEKYCNGNFIKRLPPSIIEDIRKYGIRNSHLISVAPTGTISITADNVSSGCEPPFLLEYTRDIRGEDGSIRTTDVTDYAYREWGIAGRTTADITVDEHLAVQAVIQEYTDSAVSKTINLPADISWEDFKNVYMTAWKLGAKGCTTYRPGGMREGILRAKKTESSEESGAACFIDPETGKKTCD